MVDEQTTLSAERSQQPTPQARRDKKR